LLFKFTTYATYFSGTLEKNIDKHIRLIQEHKELVDSLSDKTKAYFVSALSAAGIFRAER